MDTRYWLKTLAGQGIGILDQDYESVGATIVTTAAEIYSQAELIIKVKEPELEECQQLRSGQVLFTFLHLAPNLTLTKALLDSNCVAIAYETVNRSERSPAFISSDERSGWPIGHSGGYALS